MKCKNEIPFLNKNKRKLNPYVSVTFFSIIFYSSFSWWNSDYAVWWVNNFSVRIWQTFKGNVLYIFLYQITNIFSMKIIFFVIVWLTEKKTKQVLTFLNSAFVIVNTYIPSKYKLKQHSYRFCLCASFLSASGTRWPVYDIILILLIVLIPKEFQSDHVFCYFNWYPNQIRG